MRERIRDKERLEHMLQAIDVIIENKDKQSYEEVIANPIMYFGFVKHVEIIGEACFRSIFVDRRCAPRIYDKSCINQGLNPLAR